jgi:hypothetical protein
VWDGGKKGSEEGRMCRRARRVCRGTTKSFPWVFSYDEEGGGEIYSNF